ncbi:flagellar hook assembly protein FlgD [Ancylobacter radicis]|uniref:Basal-body rod modification protein FlgD n=1 Tax=Ancylobacter radicis TaxID=2836179 RepID=A0ABS5RE03_9HYPH|nr:flagellar hook assembly protein FlgD [Ancylobacter radicis]MBS9479297.1 flagellar hook assembly protein FlgD [Ancylobacter radicis]
MTQVNPLSSASTATTSAAAKPQTLDYSAFLQLLIAQMKNQDPTEPMDSAQYMGQLASFSQVEQSMAANAKLDSLLTSSSLQIADAAIGRTVTSADGLVSGTVTSVRIAADAPIATLADGRELALSSGVRMS